MPNDLVGQLLENRADFLKHLKKDIAKTDGAIESATSELDDLKIATSNVRDLGKKVEHPALLPLGKKIYVNGTIVHTGEYFLDKLAFPESYSVVETLDSTIQHLERRVKKQTELLERSEEAKRQLQERVHLIEGQGGDESDLPKEIVSEKGVAVKMGEFYEILEFEN